MKPLPSEVFREKKGSFSLREKKQGGGEGETSQEKEK